jgi:GNAT superfamily N-acetyltransferase
MVDPAVQIRIRAVDIEHMRVVLLATPWIDEFQQRAVQGILSSGRHTVAGRLVDGAPGPPPSWARRRRRGGYMIVMAVKRIRRRLRPSPDTAEHLRGTGIPVFRAAERYSDETLAWIAAREPDVLLRLGGFELVERPLLEAAPRGVISYHFGDMREYRGHPPGFWELMHGESGIGITVQRLTEQLDAGEPIVEHRLAIGRTDTTRTLTRRMLEACPPMMLEALDRLEEPTFRSAPLDSYGPLYPLPNPRQRIWLRLKVARRVTLARASALGWLLFRSLRARLDVGYVYHFDLRRPVPDFRADTRVEMHRAERADVEEAALMADPDDPTLREKFVARLDAGIVCFVAKIDGRIVAYNWAMFRSGEDDGDTIVLGPGELYTTDGFTAPAYRGRKIHTETLAYILQTAQAEGYLDAYTLASVFKRRARKTHDRLGWRLSGRVLLIRTEDLLHVRARGPFSVLACAGSPRPLVRRRAPRAAGA